MTWPPAAAPTWSRVETPWGQPVDPERLLAAHPSPAIIAVVHAETSTGVRSDIAPLGVGKGDALLLVDCVTSVGGIEVDVDGWGVDVAYAGTQKCLGVPPGLAPLTLSDRARERLVERSPSWYLDLRMIGRYTGPGHRRPDVPPHRPGSDGPVAARRARRRSSTRASTPRSPATPTAAAGSTRGCRDLGLELFAAEGHRLPELTTVWVPDGVDDAKVRAALLDRYGIEIGGGLGEFAGRVWRIGCMGHTARPRNVALAARRPG